MMKKLQGCKPFYTAGLTAGLTVGLLLVLGWALMTGWFGQAAAPRLAHASTNLSASSLDQPTDGPGDDDDNEERVRGLLIAAPVDGLGPWLIQVSATVTVTVVANQQTRLDDGVPLPGMWVRADVLLQDDGSRLAERIRLDDAESDEMVVRLADAAALNAITRTFGLTLRETLLSSAYIYLLGTADDDDLDDLLEELQDDERVIWAELNYVGGVTEGDPYKTWGWGGVDPDGFINQSAFAQINLPSPPPAPQGNGVIIAVLDTGIDRTHPALLGRWLPGRDMVADDDNPQEEAGLAWGHGTHIAGVISHIAPQSQLLPVRVLDGNGRGNAFTLAYAIEWAVQQGADVINLSLGTPFRSRVLEEAIADAAESGVILVAAAGNTNTAQAQYPARFDDVLAVTALDSANRKASFANYGGWVDLAAPGVGITSTVVGPLGSGYAGWSGTSMATAFVSGAAALVRADHPAAAPAQIAEQLLSTASDLAALNPGHADQLGGLLDVAAALEVPVTTTPTPAPTASATPTPVPPTPTRNPPVGTPAPQLYLPWLHR